VRRALPDVTERRACRVLEVSRSARHPPPRPPARRATSQIELEQRVRALIERHPTFGYRRLWALLRRAGHAVNRKTVHLLLRRKGWLVHQREVTPRPRVQGRRSRAQASDERWAMDQPSP